MTIVTEDNRAGIGDRLRARRLQLHMTQREVAGSAYTSAYISALENGLVRPSMRALEHLSVQLGLSIPAIVGEPEPRAMPRPRRSPEQLNRHGRCECGAPLGPGERHTTVVDCVRGVRDLLEQVNGAMRYLTRVTG